MLMALGGACLPALHASDVKAHLSPTGKSSTRVPPAVIWLQPLQPASPYPVVPGRFTLVQKNKMFSPHLLVVPVGSSVAFPNADPYFHNVFSLYNGRRFDLGLYEAGSTRSVVFSREGVSFIFCNIHSEMSAVVISLATPFYGIANERGEFRMSDVPEGEYQLHVWVEGRPQETAEPLRRVHVGAGENDLGAIHAEHTDTQEHLNKFGKPYEPDSRPVY